VGRWAKVQPRGLQLALARQHHRPDPSARADLLVSAVLKGLILAVGLSAAALGGAIPAHAFTDGEAAYVADMESLGISAHHGHIADNAQESRGVLQSGYAICDHLHSGWALIDVKRNILTNSHTRVAMGESGQLTADDIDAQIASARRNLCPDTL
jgi:hypothetical protein